MDNLNDNLNEDFNVDFTENLNETKETGEWLSTPFLQIN